LRAGGHAQLRLSIDSRHFNLCAERRFGNVIGTVT
jgi:hypothetical protein